ncbi:hypothetical protein AUEXF2481DRAFT_419203 [Aureobasidium subglaciale EXF-2481]|uniref:Uncharacterized protein n=1 Tax=Aureobasidium subglaciale (strain EXF-2481) TaxID=1043005 RepID=A0A074Y8W8_AURSE|nr:uncharacterized protein AUEXF2481DRAFT_419203 [Aureobasidium subglaciale EXF-2481]KEQ92449.1 hypothetical protein AUEXF2481DRAFT_419203 [Aureobasidium subglaciale EXF-2481]
MMKAGGLSTMLSSCADPSLVEGIVMMGKVRFEGILLRWKARAKLTWLTWLHLPAVNKVRDSNNRCKAPPHQLPSTTSSSSLYRHHSIKPQL